MMVAMPKKEGEGLILTEDITQKIEVDTTVQEVEEELGVVDMLDKIEPVLPIRQKTTWTDIPQKIAILVFEDLSIMIGETWGVMLQVQILGMHPTMQDTALILAKADRKETFHLVDQQCMGIQNSTRLQNLRWKGMTFQPFLVQVNMRLEKLVNQAMVQVLGEKLTGTYLQVELLSFNKYISIAYVIIIIGIKNISGFLTS